MISDKDLRDEFCRIMLHGYGMTEEKSLKVLETGIELYILLAELESK